MLNPKILLQTLLPVFVLVLLVCGLASAQAKGGGRLVDIRFGQQKIGARIVLELEKTGDFRVAAQDSPAVLTVELPALTGLPDLHTIKTEAPVTSLRHELAQGASRVVFDLNGPVTVKNAFMIGPQGKKPARLVIDIAPGSAAGKARAFGTLAPAMAPAASYAAMPETANTQAPAPQTEAVTPQPQSVPDIAVPATITFKPLVAIDAGHGGQDPGATSADGVREKNVTLAAALELAEALRKTGRYRVMLTREGDHFVKLGDRVMAAREAQADLFVSLHADSMGAGAERTATKGASVYTLSTRASDAQAASLAARENAADNIGGVNLSTQSPDVANILIDLMMRDTAGKSSAVAGDVIAGFRAARVATLPGPHKSAGFVVLKAPDIPSILIEMGYLSNAGEAALLNDPAHRKTLVAAILGGIDAFFKKQGVKTP